MKMTARIFVLLLLFVQARAWAQKPIDPVNTLLAAQEKHGQATDFFGVLKWEKSGGEAQAGNFWVQGERFRLQLGDKEIIGDGTYLWEIQHRGRKVEKSHYDPYNAPAVVQAVRLLRLDLESEHVVLTANGNDVVVEIETGSSVAQGNHVLGIDPKTHDITAITLHENQGAYLERAEIGQFRSDMKFAVETFSVKPEDWKSKGYSLLDMAKGENLTVLPEEKALRPIH